MSIEELQAAYQKSFDAVFERMRKQAFQHGYNQGKTAHEEASTLRIISMPERQEHPSDIIRQHAETIEFTEVQ